MERRKQREEGKKGKKKKEKKMGNIFILKSVASNTRQKHDRCSINALN